MKDSNIGYRDTKTFTLIINNEEASKNNIITEKNIVAWRRTQFRHFEIFRS